LREAPQLVKRGVRRGAATLAQLHYPRMKRLAAAEQVKAATDEPSAAYEEMTSASHQLLEGSTQLRQLVAGLRTG
jgi:hypothetical protein